MSWFHQVHTTVRNLGKLRFENKNRNSQKVREGQGNLSRLSVQEDQQYHVVQQYPEVQEYQNYPVGGREKVVRHEDVG